MKNKIWRYGVHLGRLWISWYVHFQVCFYSTKHDAYVMYCRVRIPSLPRVRPGMTLGRYHWAFWIWINAWQIQVTNWDKHPCWGIEHRRLYAYNRRHLFLKKAVISWGNV